MSVWVCINVSTALIASAIMAYMLGAYPDKFNVFERVGKALMGAGMLMRIGPIVMKPIGENSPFDDWSVTLLHVGITVYLLGRLHRHLWLNWQARRDARTYLRGRGKL